MQGKQGFKISGAARLLLMMCFVLIANLVLAQSEILDIQGNIKDSFSMKKLESVKITVIQNGKQFDSFTTTGSGKYTLELPLGYDYKIQFSKLDFVAKTIEIRTKDIPEEDMRGGFQMSMDVSIFENQEGFNTSILDKPIGIASFDPQRNSIEFDFPYTEGVMDEIEAEFERLEDLEANMEKMLKEFNDLIEKGDQKMGDEKYEDAIRQYEDALDIFPDKEPAPEKLAEAKKKLDEQNALANREAEYERLIDSGNNRIKTKDYESAKSDFEAARDLKPEEREPKDKLAEIEKLLEALEMQEQYDSLVAEADALFKSSDYEKAISKYETALDFMPKESYPRDQIAEARKRIENAEAEAEAAAERERKYQEAIALGQKNIDSNELKAALRNFEEARTLKPEEALPKDKIDEINQLIKDQEAEAMAAEEAAAANAEQERIDAEYQALLDKANEDFDKDKLDEAKSKYQEALGLKPNEKFPQTRIDKIDEIIRERESNEEAAIANAEREKVDNEYQTLIDKANVAFDQDDLTSARADYTAALEIKSNEKYPKSRIARIDEILAEREALAQNDAAEAERLRREEERRAAEAAAAADREEKERLLEEERLRREQEAQAEADRKEAERLAAEEEERRRQEEFMNNANTSTEDEAEKYYREARASEARAKAKAKEQEKENVQEYLADKAADANYTRKQNLEDGQAKEDELIRIFRDGEMNREGKLQDTERVKEKNQSESSEMAKSAEGRRQDADQELEELEIRTEELSEKDRYREDHVRDVQDLKDENESSQSSYIKRGNVLRSDGERKAIEQKENQSAVSMEGSDLQKMKVDATAEIVEQHANFESDTKSAADERRVSSIDASEKEKNTLESIPVGKESLREEKNYEIEQEKENQEFFLAENAEESRLRNYDARKALFDKDAGSDKTPEEYILPEGAEDLEEGVQERSYEQGNKMVIERTVKRGNKVDLYRKVISKTGIYYFKNERAITETTWVRETLDVKD
jgi:hypothetical protein